MPTERLSVFLFIFMSPSLLLLERKWDKDLGTAVAPAPLPEKENDEAGLFMSLPPFIEIGEATPTPMDADDSNI